MPLHRLKLILIIETNKQKTKFISFKLQPHVIFKNCYIHAIYFHGKVNRTTKQNASLLFKLLFFVDFLNMHIIGHKCAKCCTLLNVFSLISSHPCLSNTKPYKNRHRSTQSTYIPKRNGQLNSWQTTSGSVKKLFNLLTQIARCTIPFHLRKRKPSP